MSEALRVRSTIEFKSWRAPSFAIVRTRPQPEVPADSISIPIADLDADALDELADAWLRDLYGKVSRRSPFQLPPKAGPS